LAVVLDHYEEARDDAEGVWVDHDLVKYLCSITGVNEEVRVRVRVRVEE